MPGYGYNVGYGQTDYEQPEDELASQINAKSSELYDQQEKILKAISKTGSGEVISMVAALADFLIAKIMETRDLAIELTELYSENLDASDDNFQSGQLALYRLAEAMGADVDTIDSAITFEGQDMQIVKVKESVMWALTNIMATK